MLRYLVVLNLVLVSSVVWGRKAGKNFGYNYGAGALNNKNSDAVDTYIPLSSLKYTTGSVGLATLPYYLSPPTRNAIGTVSGYGTSSNELGAAYYPSYQAPVPHNYGPYSQQIHTGTPGFGVGSTHPSTYPPTSPLLSSHYGGATPVNYNSGFFSSPQAGYLPPQQAGYPPFQQGVNPLFGDYYGATSEYWYPPGYYKPDPNVVQLENNGHGLLEAAVTKLEGGADSSGGGF